MYVQLKKANNFHQINCLSRSGKVRMLRLARSYLVDVFSSGTHAHLVYSYSIVTSR